MVGVPGQPWTAEWTVFPGPAPFSNFAFQVRAAVWSPFLGLRVPAWVLSTLVIWMGQASSASISFSGKVLLPLYKDRETEV
jgi:hypothetical protein